MHKYLDTAHRKQSIVPSNPGGRRSQHHTPSHHSAEKLSQEEIELFANGRHRLNSGFLRNLMVEILQDILGNKYRLWVYW